MLHQPADVILSRKWAALEQLTYLELSGLGSLQQEGGAGKGALHCIFQHLQTARLQIGACRGLAHT